MNCSRALLISDLVALMAVLSKLAILEISLFSLILLKYVLSVSAFLAAALGAVTASLGLLESAMALLGPGCSGATCPDCPHCSTPGRGER